MERDFQIWLIVFFLGLHIGIQLLIIVFLIRMLNLLKPTLGTPGVRDIATKAVATMEAVNRATTTTAELMTQIRPTVQQAASISKRQLSHADQVVGDVLDSVEGINQAVHDVAAAIGASLREAHAVSVGVRSATSTYFGKPSNLNKRKQKQW